MKASDGVDGDCRAFAWTDSKALRPGDPAFIARMGAELGVQRFAACAAPWAQVTTVPAVHADK